MRRWCDPPHLADFETMDAYLIAYLEWGSVLEVELAAPARERRLWPWVVVPAALMGLGAWTGPYAMAAATLIGWCVFLFGTCVVMGSVQVPDEDDDRRLNSRSAQFSS
jgi:hypothetical protein